MRKLRGKVEGGAGDDFYERMSDYVKKRRQGLDKNVIRWASKKFIRKSKTISKRSDGETGWEITESHKKKRRKAADAAKHSMDKSVTAVGVPAALAGAAIGIGTLLAAVPVVLLIAAGSSAAYSKRRDRKTKKLIKDIVRRLPDVENLYTRNGNVYLARTAIRVEFGRRLCGANDDEGFYHECYEYVTDNGFKDYENAKTKYVETLRRFAEHWKENERALSNGDGWNEFAKLYAESIYRWERYTTYAVLIQEVMHAHGRRTQNEMETNKGFMQRLLDIGQEVADVTDAIDELDEVGSESDEDDRSGRSEDESSVFALATSGSDEDEGDHGVPPNRRRRKPRKELE